MASATQSDQMDRLVYIDRPALLLARVGRITERRFAEELKATGMKAAHVGILINLRELGPVSQQSLGELLHIDPSNLVALLNVLEEEGLATRRRDPTDRRRHIVEISERGFERIEQAETPIERIEDELLARLSPEDREQLRALLARILEAASPEDLEEDAVVPELN
jgi:DNA-binding MarR family transcriptional regulator